MEDYSAQKELNDFLANGGSMRALANMSQEDLDQLYGYAYSLKQAGDYAGARNVFYLLTWADHWNFDYWLGLGICCQHLGQHEEALMCFHHSGVLKVSDPRSSYLAGLSYQLIGNPDKAKTAFTASQIWCERKPEYAQLKTQVEQAARMCDASRGQS
jgi:secretion system chaperone SscA